MPTPAINYKIVALPQYVSDIEAYLNTIGSGSWQLINVYNNQAYLMSGSTSTVSVSGSLTLPVGTVSSSTQYPGWVTSSAQIDYTLIKNTGGNISSSTQFKTLTNPFTGSFTGSFVGTLTGTTLGTASYASVSPGGGIVAVTSITASYTASATDQVILMSASSANQIVNLPTAVNNAGKRYWVKNISTAQPFSITPTGTQKIDTAVSTSVAVLGAFSGSSYSLVSDGANWWQLSQH
jgi:hypothetical protein